MNCCILMGSPREDGNTIMLTKPFMRELERKGCQCRLIWLSHKTIGFCTACRSCQGDWTKVSCCQKDDMEDIFREVLACDLLVLATPVYSWYCTPPMKAALDRLVYGMNKYYGQEKGPSLWAGKKLALITTCGYRPEQGADLWETGMKRYCRHSRLIYMGMLVERHLGYQTVFMDEEKERHAVHFADRLVESLKKPNQEESH